MMSFDQGADYLGIQGALLLARRIERYWAERGHEVETRTIVDGRAHEGNRAFLYVVRSNMLNGLPPTYPSWIVRAPA